MVEYLVRTVAEVGAGTVHGLVAVVAALESIAVTSAVAPGETVLVLAGASGAPWPTLLAAAVTGVLAGESAGFWLGRRLGPSLRRGRLGRRLSPERFRRAERTVARGGVGLLGVRFLGPLQSLAPLAAGALGMPYARYLAWSTAGALLWAGVYLGVGALLGGAAVGVTGPVGLASLAIVATTAVVAVVLLRRSSAVGVARGSR